MATCILNFRMTSTVFVTIGCRKTTAKEEEAISS